MELSTSVVKNNVQQTLVEAVKSSTLEDVKLAIENTIDINYRDAQEWTALMHAVCRNDPQMVQSLLDAGAYVNICDYDGVTPLLLAIDRASDEKIISILLDAGGDVFIRNRDYKNALNLAAENPRVNGTVVYDRIALQYQEG